MKSDRQKLLIMQSDKRLEQLKPLERTQLPAKGWVYTIRKALRMSLRQLGKRLGISAQSAKEIEEREINGTITIKSLREAASALNMKLVYGFIPQQESLERMIEKRAEEKAREIVLRTSNSMRLEAQENSESRIEYAIKSKTEEIKNKMPNYLWD